MTVLRARLKGINTEKALEPRLVPGEGDFRRHMRSESQGREVTVLVVKWGYLLLENASVSLVLVLGL